MEELEQLIQESIQIMENDFYSKPFQFSYSSLNKLLWNPQAFYQMYVLGNKEEKTDSYLVNGKIIHTLLLEEHKFNDQFIVSPSKLPNDNTKIVLDRVFAHAQELQKNGDTRTELADYENAVLDVLLDMNLHQSLKTDQQRIDKINTQDAINYWEFMKNKGSKILIDQATYDFCKTGVDLIKMNNQVSTLLGLDTNDFSNKEVFNELSLTAKMNNKPFNIKGIIDNLVIDHDKKTIYINDVKTTSKDLKDFHESIEFYNYSLQAAIYCSLIGIKFINLIDAGYKMKFHFVVIDKSYQVYPFPVSDSTLNNWLSKLLIQLDKAEWHYVNKNYELPYDFALGNVVL